MSELRFAEDQDPAQASIPTPQALPHSAKVRGEMMTELPTDLYIPPDALEVFFETFEGPLDLLLYLIRKANVDILDIPMARLTEQYLVYVEAMRHKNLELAADYLVMAAILIEIKSRMLLPRPRVVAGDEDLDPRAELVRRLLEYEQMKQAALEIDALPHLGRDFYSVEVWIEQTLTHRLPQVNAADLEAAVPLIVDLVKNRIPNRFGFDPIRDVQVLCPMNRGGVGARSLNIELQAALNPAKEQKVERFGWTFAPGDKVMQIENDYEKEVYNGDVGYIDAVDLDTGELIASFDGRPVTYGFGELDTLVPAYAATIHKSQGSEYPAVVIPVMTQHYTMLQRNLIYTGITRGKKLVVIVGQAKAVAIAVKNVSGRRRWTKLKEWLGSTPKPAIRR